MFPNRSGVVLIGLLPGLVLVVASDRCSTQLFGQGEIVSNRENERDRETDTE